LNVVFSSSLFCSPPQKSVHPFVDAVIFRRVSFAAIVIRARKPFRPDSRVKKPSLAALLLALVPFTAICFCVPFWDRIYPTVFGLPFNFFWLILWLFLTPLCMWGAYLLEAPRAAQPANNSESGTR
jgi:hypothetical protein